MPKYLLSYHGGSMPQSPEEGERVMAAWNKWIGEAGTAMVDPGQPTGETRTVAPGGAVSNGGGAHAVTGYSIVEVDSFDTAMKIAGMCPQLDSGGTVEVGELLKM